MGWGEGDLSRYVGRNMSKQEDLYFEPRLKPYRRKKVSHGEWAGIPALDTFKNERVWCPGCYKVRRFKDLYSVYELAPNKAWQMRFCKYCDTMCTEKEYDLSEAEESSP